jgi:hypothetical protein
MATRVRRSIGCAPPFEPLQLAAAAGQVVFTALGYTTFALYAGGEGLPVTMVLYTVPVAAVAFGWAYCSFVDPGIPGGLPVPCVSGTQARERYCSKCRKVIPGLDHHCVWLNTCIGKVRATGVGRAGGGGGAVCLCAVSPRCPWRCG